MYIVAEVLIVQANDGSEDGEGRREREEKTFEGVGVSQSRDPSENGFFEQRHRKKG